MLANPTRFSKFYPKFSTCTFSPGKAYSFPETASVQHSHIECSCTVQEVLLYCTVQGGSTPDQVGRELLQASLLANKRLGRTQCSRQERKTKRNVACSLLEEIWPTAHWIFGFIKLHHLAALLEPASLPCGHANTHPLAGQLQSHDAPSKDTVNQHSSHPHNHELRAIPPPLASPRGLVVRGACWKEGKQAAKQSVAKSS